MRKHLWFAILGALCALSCQEDNLIVSSSDSLVDPHIMPKVIFTYPPLNSSGPYPDWELPSWTSPGTRFEIRFNKLMDLSSVRRAVHLNSTLRTLSIDSGSVYSSGRDYFYFTPNEIWYQVPNFRLGEVLTLSLAQPVSDVNGNMLAAGELGTFIPEPAFRVRQVNPAPGTVLTAQFSSYIDLMFNSKIDSSILPYVSVSPELHDRWSISADSMTLEMPTWNIEAAARYIVTVAAGAPDREGHRSPVPFTVQYFGVPFSVVERTPLEITALPLYTEYRLTFSFPVDTATFRGALHFTPALAGGVIVSNYPQTQVWFRPAIEYRASTHYDVRIDTTLMSMNGVHLSQEYAFSFETAEFRVNSNYPEDGATNISTSDAVIARFTANLDSSTIRKSFKIVPPAAGIFPFLVNSSMIYFYPADTLIQHQTYVVTIDTTVRSKSGYRILAPFTFSFTTGSY